MAFNWYFWIGIAAGFLVMRQVIGPMFESVLLGPAEADLKRFAAKLTPAERAKARADAIASGATPSDLAKVGL